ncbi:MAG: efflux RND transporter permease subunit [Clostridiales bacterium]|nr:efflux RND transporter permease subunit [Clostridiales bacterium]
MNLTKTVLKRPVTVLMVLLCLVVFGCSSLMNATLEQMPDTNTPMLIISASYTGTSPEDVDELVTQPIENAVSTLEGVKSISSTSSEGRSMVMLEYGYDQDMDEAYDTLKKKVDSLRGLPDDVEPSIMEMNNNQSESIMLSVSDSSKENLYDFVDQKVVPELEKLSTAAEVSVRGGSSEYIKVELKSDMMKQYGVTLSNITSAISSADLSYPSGSAVSGNQELNVTTSVKNDTLDDLLRVPITGSSGKIVYLEDIADIYYTQQNMGGVSRYNGEETISITVTKVQSASAMELSSQVKEAVNSLMADNESLEIDIVRDSADTILDSLKDVAVTMLLAVVISMLVLFLFFGDVKASLIVGSSIPVSILVTLIVMTSLGMSLNVITMSGLVLSVGMMVDNSIVTLESCFRAKELVDENDKRGYALAALTGTGGVIMSIIGSTLTTCVVFIPLIFLNGMAGKMFGSLGYVIVISMAASLLSAVSIVPLTYMLYRPSERGKALLSAPVAKIQNAYRRILPVLLRHKWKSMLCSLLLIAAAVLMSGSMESELMTSDDTGTISVSIETRPGLIDEKANDILTRAEQVVSGNENVDSYMMRYSNASGTITVYLKDDRKTSTDDLVEIFEKELADLDNCTVTVSASSSMSFMGRNRGYSAIIQGTQYDELQEVTDTIVKELTARNDVMNVHSSIENTAPVVSVNVDSVTASAEGLTAQQIGSQIRNYLEGTELTTLTVDGNEIKVKAEYPDGEYETVPQVERMLLSKPNGSYVSLSDVAEIVYKDSPSSISKQDKSYQVTIRADYVNGNVSDTLDKEVIEPNLTGTVTKGVDSRQKMMNSEFSGLYTAIATAVFLVFVVLAAQFESPKFSFMVMTTIPFSLAGSFAALKLTGVSMSMTSLIGFLILVGTVVNNGILYVDAVNQERTQMSITDALIEAGATRLRPILMTTMTTVFSMLPMATAYGSSGATTQGLAVVDIGGLIFGVAVALFILPVYYLIINGRKELSRLDI